MHGLQLCIAQLPTCEETRFHVELCKKVDGKLNYETWLTKLTNEATALLMKPPTIPKPALPFTNRNKSRPISVLSTIINSLFSIRISAINSEDLLTTI